MESRSGVTIEALAERIKAVQDDVAELRDQRKDDHHRLRNVESAVSQMLEAQKIARESEQRQYRRLGNRIALGALSVSLAMLALATATILIHVL